MQNVASEQKSREFSIQNFALYRFAAMTGKKIFLQVSMQCSQAVKDSANSLLRPAECHFILLQRCKAALSGPKAWALRSPEIKGQSTKPLCLASHYKESFNLTKLI